MELPNGKPAVVLDAGGTNLRAAQVTYLGGKAEIKGERVLPMPGTRGKLSWTEFLHQLAKITAPYAKEAVCLGFCFSFPAEITPEIDGRILCFNKEVQVEGAEGKLVCRELVELLNREYGCAISHFALLNDTVATLLGGFGAQPYGKYDSYIGFILGTGMNCCYVEPEKSMIINMEAGGYAGFPRGTFDRVLDESSTNPGEHYFEKMVSGGYLGTVILETLRGACREGLFSKEFSQAVDAMSMDMAGISAYLDAPLGDAALAKACTSPNRHTAALVRGGCGAGAGGKSRCSVVDSRYGAGRLRKRAMEARLHRCGKALPSGSVIACGIRLRIRCSALPSGSGADGSQFVSVENAEPLWRGV